MRAVAGAMSRLASRVMRCQVTVVMYLERFAGYVTSGVYVFTREHIPNILKDNRNRFKDESWSHYTTVGVAEGGER